MSSTAIFTVLIHTDMYINNIGELGLCNALFNAIKPYTLFF